MNQKYQDLIALLQFVFQGKPWVMRDEPVTVRASWMDSDLVEIWQVFVSPAPERHLYIMEGNGETTEVGPDHRYAAAVTDAIRNRLHKDYKNVIKQVA